MVWEGVNTTSVVLAAGLASVTLTAHREDSSTCVPAWQAPAGTGGPAECMYADRNIDAILFHPNRTDLGNRWASDVDTGVLAFDGLFSQAGEVFFRVTNHDTNSSAPPMALAVPCGDFHNPWNLGDPRQSHLRLGANAGPLLISVAPGTTSAWVDTGALLTT